MRDRVVAFVEEQRADGVPVGSIVRSLGLSAQTVAVWRRRPRRRVRRVELAVMTKTETPRVDPTPGLRLITPRGLRVEGLDPQTLLTVLRELA